MTKVEIHNQQGENLGSFEIDASKPLLGQLEKNGIEIPNACRTGMCGSCLCKAKSGEEFLVKNLRGEPAFPLSNEEIMTCIGGVKDTNETIILETIS